MSDFPKVPLLTAEQAEDAAIALTAVHHLIPVVVDPDALIKALDAIGTGRAVVVPAQQPQQQPPIGTKWVLCYESDGRPVIGYREART